MAEILVILALGFFLGMRHATDADHVIAVTTIVSRQREILGAALTGLLWGAGHSLTIIAVGSAIILLDIAIPYRVSVGMELSVGVMLIVLGILNLAAYAKLRPGVWRRIWQGGAQEVHAHVHSHGDYVHTHPHGHAPEVHPHGPDQTPLAAIDRRFGRFRLYTAARPVVVGAVHGMAGSAAVTLLVVAAVADPLWAVAYLFVFSAGTMAGMMVITMSIAAAFRLAGGRSEMSSRWFALACGAISVVFGLTFAYQVWSNAGSLPPGR